MTTEAPPAAPSPSIEERMARIEAQQEIIIELLQAHNTRFERIDEKFDRMDEKFDRIDERFDRMDEKFDRMDEKFDEVHRRIDAVNQRMFFAGLGLFTIVGTGVATYIVNLIV